MAIVVGTGPVVGTMANQTREAVDQVDDMPDAHSKIEPHMAGEKSSWNPSFLAHFLTLTMRKAVHGREMSVSPGLWENLVLGPRY